MNSLCELMHIRAVMVQCKEQSYVKGHPDETARSETSTYCVRLLDGHTKPVPRELDGHTEGIQSQNSM